MKKVMLSIMVAVMSLTCCVGTVGFDYDDPNVEINEEGNPIFHDWETWVYHQYVNMGYYVEFTD